MYEDDLYPTAEHAFHAAKTSKAKRGVYVMAGVDAKEAKRLGQTLPITRGRKWWDANKVAIMFIIVCVPLGGCVFPFFLFFCTVSDEKMPIARVLPVLSR